MGAIACYNFGKTEEVYETKTQGKQRVILPWGQIVTLLHLQNRSLVYKFYSDFSVNVLTCNKWLFRFVDWQNIISPLRNTGKAMEQFDKECDLCSGAVHLYKATVSTFYFESI